VTTRPFIRRAFECAPGVINVRVSSGPSYVTVLIEWSGRGSCEEAMSEIARASIAAGVHWSIEIHAWRWRWLRTIGWPAKRWLVQSSDRRAVEGGRS